MYRVDTRGSVDKVKYERSERGSSPSVVRKVSTQIVDLMSIEPRAATNLGNIKVYVLNKRRKTI
jgi:hypothetical protein